MGFRTRLLLFGYPALELVTMYVLAQYIGWGWTLIAVLAGIPIGIVVMRAAALRGNALTFLGGILFAIPGLWTDLAALFMIFPPTQQLVRGRMDTWARTRMTMMRFPGASFGAAGYASFDGDIVQGTVIHDDDTPPATGSQPTITP